jgi:hypothetical protein
VATASPLLCAAGVSLLCLTICRLLPSSGITRLRWYYETIDSLLLFCLPPFARLLGILSVSLLLVR